MAESHKSHPVELTDDQLLAQCEVRRQRRSGPGGQHRNKVETAVVLTHVPTGVRAQASERRSQERNRQMALRRLRLRLAIDVRSQRTDQQLPSALARRRLSRASLQIDPDHVDYARLLAEVLDVLAECQWQANKAASRLQVTASRLIKLIAKDAAAWQLVNDRRQALGLHAWRK